MYRTLNGVKLGLSPINFFQVDNLLCVNVLTVGEIILGQRSVTIPSSSVFLVPSLSKQGCLL